MPSLCWGRRNAEQPWVFHCIFCTEKTPCPGRRWSVVKIPKVWSAQLVSILVSSGQTPTLFTDWSPLPSPLPSIDCIMMEVEKWDFNWKGHAQGVRGDTWKGISLHFSFLTDFQLKGFYFHKVVFFAGQKNGKTKEKHIFPPSFPFPPLLWIHWSF